MGSDTWNKVMALKDNGKSEARGVANQLTEDDLNTICGTIDFFGGDWRQDMFDLKMARYRVFDWLAMRVQGRHSANPAEAVVTKVLVHSFLKAEGVPSKMIEDLQMTDYDIDHSWEQIELEDEE